MCAWGIPNHALLQRLSAIQQRVFIANGESDPMILPHFSYLLAGLIPGAKVKIYPDSAHGFLFQHHAEFAADVEQFLRSNDIDSALNGVSNEGNVRRTRQTASVSMALTRRVTLKGRL